MSDEYCERCRKPAPQWESDDYSVSDWEALVREDGTVGVICSGCVTGAEQQAMDEDMMDDMQPRDRLGRWRKR